MILTYKITLEGIKGFSRVYEIDSEMSLYIFHKQMGIDMGLPHDCRILFKAFDERGKVLARYAFVDLGSGSVDKVKMGETYMKGITDFVYYYDVDDRKKLEIHLEGIKPGIFTATAPDLVSHRGPDPEAFENGFISYEDMSEDEKAEAKEDGFDEDYDSDDIEEEDGKQSLGFNVNELF